MGAGVNFVVAASGSNYWPGAVWPSCKDKCKAAATPNGTTSQTLSPKTWEVADDAASKIRGAACRHGSRHSGSSSVLSSCGKACAI